MGFILCLGKLCRYSTRLFKKCFIYKELGQGNFYYWIRKFIYNLPKKNVTAIKIMLTSISYIAFVTELYRLQASKTSELFFLLLLLVTYSPSTTTLRFPHSSSINISLEKSTKFPIPSSFSSTMTTFSEGLSFSSTYCQQN